MSAVDNLSKWVLGSLKKASETSHPVDSVDNKTIPAVQGDRAAENATDANAQTPGQPAASAPAASDTPAVGGTSGTPANEGTGAGMSGDRPSESVKTQSDDPGTSHAAKASFATLDDVKSAGLSVLAALASAKKSASMPIVVEVEKVEKEDKPEGESSECCDKCSGKTDGGKCAACGNKHSVSGASEDKQAEDKKPDADGDGVPDWADKKPGEPDQAKSDAEMAEAKEAGAAAADAVINALGLVGDKKSASVQLVEDVVKSAEYDAANVFDYLAGFTKAATEAYAQPADAGMEQAGADITPEQLMQLLNEAGVTPEELLVELVRSGQIPPEVAEQILSEAESVAQASNVDAAAAQAMAPMPEAPSQVNPAMDAAQVNPAMDATQQELSKGAAVLPGNKVEPAKAPIPAPNESETKVVGAKKQSKAAILKAALSVLENK